MAAFVEQHTVFEFTEGREMVDEERARVLLAGCEHVTSPTSIRLSNKSYSLSAANLIAEKLRSFSSLTVADISDIIAGRHEDEALQVLATVCESLADKKLEVVNVSENALGRKGVIACQGILKGKDIKKLYFCNNGMSAEASELITEIVLEGGCPPLELLHFYNNMSGSAGAIASSRLVVAAAGQLSDFRYSATRSSSEGCMAIAEALCHVSGLVRLDVSDNSFGGEVAERLAAALTLQTKLEYLSLRDAGLEEDGTRQVLEALRTARPPLMYLDLSGNDLTDDIIDDIIQLAERCPHLERLFIDDSELTLEAVTALSKVIRQKKAFQSLKTLSLCCCELSAAPAVQIARHVSRITTFEQLCIDGNQICSEGLEKIQTVLAAANKTLGGMDDNDEDGEDDLGELDDEDEGEAEEDETEGEHDNGDNELDDAMKKLNV